MNDDLHRMMGERLKERADNINHAISDLIEEKNALDNAWASWDAEALLHLDAITEDEADAIRREQGECLHCHTRDAFEEGVVDRCVSCGADREGHTRQIVSKDIEAAKAAINHAQVVCASVLGLPLDANVDEGDGSPVFAALAQAYSALCDPRADREGNRAPTYLLTAFDEAVAPLVSRAQKVRDNPDASDINQEIAIGWLCALSSARDRIVKGR